jgi:multiple sugar transport system substrate-binding protein
MVVYRKDLFEEKGLAAPNTFDNILKAIDALHNPPNMYGFVAATKTDENFMSQVLEHVLLANGCSPVDSSGIAEMGSACVEAIDFYEELAKASPPGDLFWQQSRELYFAGKAAMIIWSPFIMDELAGLRDSAPPTINDDPTSPELASKTGFITNFAGPSNPSGAAWADVRFMIITDSANTEVAQEWIKYAVGDGYVQTLSIAPEGKFPVRRGDASDSDKFVQAWSSLPVGVDRKAPLKDLYDASVINDIVAGLDVAERWGVKEGQLSAASKVINSQIINREVREVIDGNKSASDAVAAINSQISDID